ncbi:FABP family protein [Brachybacterium paraconglomeratum]|uniref:FABP family protein n=1 Tax=Brachybacterium paraconglomeratum TaxID=173362 RepID=UPI0031ECC263
MPITLDTSLPESLYPLAWLIGSWEGSGAIQQPDQDVPDARIEQQLECTAAADGTLQWRSLIHRVDLPAPLPPTSVFARDEAEDPTGSAPVAQGSGERTLLHREEGTWTVGELLPGQDHSVSEAAKPGTPASFLSHRLDARLTRRGESPEAWAGEVRGPRVQLALRDTGGEITDTRMFGYVRGQLMWLWERRLPVPGGTPGETSMAPYLSLELHRV